MKKNNTKDEIKIPKTKKQKLKLKHKKLFIVVGVLLVLLISLFIFTGNKKEDTKKPTVKKPVKESSIKIVNPNSTSRPFAVMINNVGVARPLQSGLQDAYIMYEMIVEGGITRYLALFMDTNTERIGSIRTARHYYLDYALENDAIYVHHGQSPQAQSDFSSLGVDRIVVDNSKTGWRDKTLGVASEHTLFTSIEKLNNGIGNKRTERNKDLLLNYSADEISLDKMDGAVVANHIVIPYSSYSTTSYNYNSDEKVYYRFVNDKEHVDYVTKKQYTFKNIITYKVENYTLDDAEGKGRQGINNIGSGEGYYITDGYAEKINWKKECRECQTVYTYQDGKEITVNDGNTFIQIQPSNQNLTIE